MKKLFQLITFSFFIIPATIFGQVDSLNEIIEQYQEFQKSEFRNPDQHFTSNTPDDQKRRLIFYNQQIKILSELNTEDFTEQDRINLEMLQFVITDKIAQIKFNQFLVPLNAEGGWYTDFIVSNDRKRFNSKEDYEEYIAQMAAFSEYAQNQIALMQTGIAAGRMAPFAILKGRENIVADQIVEDPEDSPFYKHFKNLPDNLSGEEKIELQKNAIKAIEESVIPAFKNFNDFWQQEYILNAPEDIGIKAQPNGRELYEQRVRFFTTLNMTPEDVYETGKKEVARIRKEMEAIIEEVEFEGTFEQFLDFLRTDEQFYAKTPVELLKEASFISKKIDGLLPKYFYKLPRNSYGVQPVPAALAPTYTGGRYSPGNLKNGRAGNYWVNTYNLPARPLYVLPSLTLHEAVPGHHLQISLAQEMESMPDFRRETYLSAFGEGWALYTEWLGEEMGIYTTPYERFGKLTYEMWRACRLVVDPGMHVFDLTRQEAIDFMANNTALSIHECTTEIDRYIGWPGQAVSYKIGELKIRQLRKLAEEKLGDNFDIRSFHDLVLSNGSVPLFILDRMVKEWINDELK